MTKITHKKQQESHKLEKEPKTSKMQRFDDQGIKDQATAGQNIKGKELGKDLGDMGAHLDLNPGVSDKDVSSLDKGNLAGSNKPEDQIHASEGKTHGQKNWNPKGISTEANQ